MGENALGLLAYREFLAARVHIPLRKLPPLTAPAPGPPEDYQSRDAPIEHRKKRFSSVTLAFSKEYYKGLNLWLG